MSDAGAAPTSPPSTSRSPTAPPPSPTAARSPRHLGPSDYVTGDAYPAPAPAGPTARRSPGSTGRLPSAPGASTSWTTRAATRARSPAGRSSWRRTRLHARLRHPDLTAGTTSQTISVSVAGDTTVEPDETFYVKLMNPTTPPSRTARASAPSSTTTVCLRRKPHRDFDGDGRTTTRFPRRLGLCSSTSPPRGRTSNFGTGDGYQPVRWTTTATAPPTPRSSPAVGLWFVRQSASATRPDGRLRHSDTPRAARLRR